MKWNPFRQGNPNPAQKENPNPPESAPGSSEAEFSEVAREVVVPAPAAASEPEEGLLIKDAWARESVKFCFWPLAQYHHPAWALADDEAEKARPAMQEFLQVLTDRYAPSALLRLAARHKEFAMLIVAMSSLAWYKFRLVRLAMLADLEAASKAASGQGESPAEVFEPTAKDRYCEVCEKTFSTMRELLDHLPCPGKIGA